MFYYKIVNSPYIIGAVESEKLMQNGTQIQKPEFDTIFNLLSNIPVEENYSYRLLETLEWERTYVPEPVSDEASKLDYENALSDLGMEIETE